MLPLRSWGRTFDSTSCCPRPSVSNREAPRASFPNLQNLACPYCRVTCLEGERDRGVTLCFPIKPPMVTNRGPPKKPVRDVGRTSLEHHLAPEVFRESFGVFTKEFDKSATLSRRNDPKK